MEDSEINSYEIEDYENTLLIENKIKDDKYIILNFIYDMMREYIDLHILDMCNENFHENFIFNIHEILFSCIENMYNINEEIYKYLYTPNILLQRAYKLIYTNYVPMRSYYITFIRKLDNNITDKITSKIELIKSIKQPNQRTNEWYEFRHNIITASNLWKIFDSQASKNSLIYEKCLPCSYSSNTAYISVNSSLHWGNKYEPLSVMLYEKQFDTIVGDFGCIKHQQFNFIGASPDGININSESTRYGRMLEIKNIVNREITKIPKKEYWIQMQIQMEVCDLNECDFLETRFIEYNSPEEYYEDGNKGLTSDGKIKGKMLLFYDNNIPNYEYYIENYHKNYDEWEEEQFIKNTNKLFMRTIYWKLDEFSCILVLRNKKWFEKAITEIQETWNTIEYEKKTGFDHRAPKKRIKKNNIIDDSKKCYINISHDIKQLIEKENINNIDYEVNY